MCAVCVLRVVQYEEEQEPLDFIVEDDQAGAGGPDGSAGGSSFIVDDGPVRALAAATTCLGPSWGR